MLGSRDSAVAGGPGGAGTAGVCVSAVEGGPGGAGTAGAGITGAAAGGAATAGPVVVVQQVVTGS